VETLELDEDLDDELVVLEDVEVELDVVVDGEGHLPLNAEAAPLPAGTATTLEPQLT
jgi:hypothetical protein